MNTNIDSALKLKRKVHIDKGYEVTIKEVKDVLTKEMHMSYKKISKIGLHSNSVNNLFLR